MQKLWGLFLIYFLNNIFYQLQSWLFVLRLQPVLEETKIWKYMQKNVLLSCVYLIFKLIIYNGLHMILRYYPVCMFYIHKSEGKLGKCFFWTQNVFKSLNLAETFNEANHFTLLCCHSNATASWDSRIYKDLTPLAPNATHEEKNCLLCKKEYKRRHLKTTGLILQTHFSPALKYQSSSLQIKPSCSMVHTRTYTTPGKISHISQLCCIIPPSVWCR